MKKTNKKPFFARLLEEQELEKVSGGAINATTKYPSDGDEVATSLANVTLKYPSDSDEGV